MNPRTERRRGHERFGFRFCLAADSQRKYDDNCDSLHEESVSEAADNSGEEAGEVAQEVEAGEMTDGGEDDFDGEGSQHLVRETVDRAVRRGGGRGGGGE